MNAVGMALLIDRYLSEHPIRLSVTSQRYGFPRAWKFTTEDFVYVTLEDARAARDAAARAYAEGVLSEEGPLGCMAHNGIEVLKRGVE